MGRTLKILAYALILFVVYLVITGFLKSCNQKKDVASAEVENTIQDDYSGDDYFEDGDAVESNGDKEEDIFDENPSAEQIDYDKIDRELEEQSSSDTRSNGDYENVDYTSPPPAPKKNNPVTKQPVRNSGSAYGDFLVIAGSYLVNSNAENMVLKLKSMGYNNSEIVVFDMSQYHTVVATRSNSYNDALAIARELKSRGVDSYVHTKR